MKIRVHNTYGGGVAVPFAVDDVGRWVMLREDGVIIHKDSYYPWTDVPVTGEPEGVILMPHESEKGVTYKSGNFEISPDQAAALIGFDENHIAKMFGPLGKFMVVM